MPTQAENRRNYLGYRGEPKIRFLKSNSTCFKEEDGGSLCSSFRVFRCKIQSRCHLGAGHLTNAAPLKRFFERDNDRGKAADLAFNHDAAIVGLRSDALQGKPRRLDSIKWADQLLCSSFVKQALGTRPAIKLNEALAIYERGKILCCAHCSITSTACSNRNSTLPGVAPASLIWIFTAPLNFERKRSKTPVHESRKPFTLVVIRACAPSDP